MSRQHSSGVWWQQQYARRFWNDTLCDLPASRPRWWLGIEEQVVPRCKKVLAGFVSCWPGSHGTGDWRWRARRDLGTATAIAQPGLAIHFFVVGQMLQ